MSRFTIDADEALEAHLAKTCRAVTEGVQKLIPAERLEGVVLGGGYGRGEGGVLLDRAGGQLPYNDMEFYVFVRGSALLGERKYRHRLHELGEALSPAAGLEVEFKVLTREKLRTSPVSMFYYDLVMGHRVCAGGPALFEGCEHHRRAEQIPLHEATRLLMNRCTGLLFSLERLQRAEFGPEESDFVGRNLAKAQLAFGDVVLAKHLRYHWSARERGQRLEKLVPGEPLSWLAEVQRHHTQGVEFKLHPVRARESREVLAQRHAELSALGRQIWLWLEGHRLRTHFGSVRDYALSAIDKCPESPPWRNRLLHLRHGGPAVFFRGKTAFYPRQRLLHALSLLLWEPEALNEPGLRAALLGELRGRATELPGLVSAYSRWWSRFN